MTEIERRLAAAARSDQEGQLAEARLEVDAAERLDAGLAFAEVLRHGAALDGQSGSSWRRSSPEDGGRLEHQHAPDAEQARDHRHEQDAGAGETTFCHMSTMPRIARTLSVTSKNVAAIPVPSAKPRLAAVKACSRIIPISRPFVTPIALSAPNCFRFSIVKR